MHPCTRYVYAAADRASDAPGVPGREEPPHDVLGRVLQPYELHAGHRLDAGGPLEVAGIDVIINPDQEAYEVEIPEVKAVYIHMIGHDCHSIVGSAGHADAIVTNLRDYLDRRYELFLTSHYRPETREDVETKIAYLQRLKEITVISKNADEFIVAMKDEFARYSGENYLAITAAAFFPQ